MNQLRRKVLDAARHLKGTPYVAHGRDTHGCDCVGLLILVARQIPQLPYGEAFDVRSYPEAPRSGFIYRQIKHYCERIRPEEALPADIVLMHQRGVSTHFGFLSERDTIIHANSGTGDVAEEPVDYIETIGRIVAYFRLRNIHSEALT